MDTKHLVSDSEEDDIFNPFEAYLNIGRHLLFRKDYKRALVYLDKCFQRIPHTSVLEEALLKCPWCTGQGTHYPVQAQELEPKNVECLLHRSTCHLYLTNNDEAIELAKIANEITKRNPHAILLIAEGYYRKGDFEMALKFFTNGKRVRSSVEEFTSGIHKCEEAIRNNCGSDIDPKLWPDMDLTDYYTHAFPPKIVSNTFVADTKRSTTSEKSTCIGKKASEERWPEMLSSEVLRMIFGKKYSEYLYIREIYHVEGKRADFLKQIGLSHVEDLYPRIVRCKENRQIVRECANCLRAKADFWYKMDPSMNYNSTL